MNPDYGLNPVTVTPGPNGTYTYSYEWAYTTGGNIYLNAYYFPDPSQQNVQLPDDGTQSFLRLVNKSNLSVNQFGILVFLHELSHIANGNSANTIDSNEYNN
jgi:hypothetical protein